MTAATTTASAMATAEPPKRLSALEQFYLSFFWLSTNVLWGAVLTILVQSQVARMVPDAIKGTAVGLAVGIGSLTALVLPAIMGAWSDRVRFRLGRRRPFMLVGIAINLVGLVGMAVFPFLSDSPLWGFTVAFWLFVAAYLVTNFGNNFATAPFSALMPDIVPEDQRGTASGWLGVMTILGYAIGVELASQVNHEAPVAIFQGQIYTVYAIIGVILVVGVLITVLGTHEKPLTTAPKPFRWGEFWAGLITPFQSRDFFWVFFTRLLMVMGFSTIQYYLPFYMADVIKDFSLFGHVVATTPEAATGNVLVTLLLFAAVATFVAGPLSDRYGRKLLVYLSGIVMTLVALGLMVAPNYLASLIIGAMFGLGYGAYTSVDWALATDVLPKMEDAAKDMGLWHMALVIPQFLATSVAGVLLDLGRNAGEARGLPTLGYLVIFSLGIVYFFLGTVFVSRVKKARAGRIAAAK